MLSTAALETFPTRIEKNALLGLLEETQAKEMLLKQTLRRLEQKYHCSLEELEARLAQGQGEEHPDSVDPIFRLRKSWKTIWPVKIPEINAILPKMAAQLARASVRFLDLCP